MCEVSGADAGASLVRGQAVGGGPHHKLGPSTCGHSAIQPLGALFVNVPHLQPTLQIADLALGLAAFLGRYRLPGHRIICG